MKDIKVEMDRVSIGIGRDGKVPSAAVLHRDCHGLLYPAGYSRRVQQGTGTGWVSPTRAIPVPPAGGWWVGPHIQTPREIDPNDARRIVWALCRYVFLPFFSRFSKLTHSLYSI